MKYILVTLSLLCGCASISTYTYECGVASGHGVYARLTIPGMHSEKEAEDEAEKVRLKLVESKLVPDSTFVKCFDGSSK